MGSPSSAGARAAVQERGRAGLGRPRRRWPDAGAAAGHGCCVFLVGEKESESSGSFILRLRLVLLEVLLPKKSGRDGAVDRHAHSEQATACHPPMRRAL